MALLTALRMQVPLTCNLTPLAQSSLAPKECAIGTNMIRTRVLHLLIQSVRAKHRSDLHASTLLREKVANQAQPR